MRIIRHTLTLIGNLSLSPSPLVLEKPKNVDKRNNATVYEFINPDTLDRLVVNIRPESVEGGEARINFKSTHGRTKEEGRVAIDLSDLKTRGHKAVSLDLGVGRIETVTEDGVKRKVYPSERPGKVLALVSIEKAHNEASFSGELAERFPQAARKFDNYLSEKF